MLVIGETDRGKSSFCSILAQELSRRDGSVTYLDADVGQKDVGPPATITLGKISAKTRSGRARLRGMYFVGSVNPMGHFLPIIVGTRRLVEEAVSPVVLMNTGGFVRGSGKALTCYQIESIRPELIVAIEAGEELTPILSEYRQMNVIRINPASAARPKSLLQRIEARQKAFSRYFKNSKEVKLRIEEVILQRQDQHSGLVDRLCGLTTRAGNCVGIGVIQSVSSKFILVSTPVLKENIAVLQLGDLWSSEDSR